MFKILIVDPNDPFRQSLKKVLMNRFPFIDIQEASEGNEGLDKVDTYDPDLIFLEIHLPARSGLDLARRIKSDHPGIVIVILTGYDSPEYQTAAEESGVEHLVAKDEWTGEDMITLVQSIITDLHVNDQNLHCGYQPPEHSS
jgi:DNA-binding NarL/FixJ family response regulator